MTRQINSIWEKAKGSYWIKSGLLILFNRLSVSLFGFASFFLLLRMLTQVEYGIWMLFISVATVIELIKAGFIRNPLIKYYQEDEDKAKVLNASLILNLLITLVIGFLLFISSKGLSIFWDQPGLEPLFDIYLIALLLLVLLHHFDYVQQANLNFKGSLFSEATRQGIFLACILTCYITGQPLTLIHLAWFQVAAIGMSVCISFVYARRYMMLSFSTEWHWVTKLFGYGKYTFGSSVSAMFMRNTDTWMLGRMMNPLAVAIYNPALRIANLLEIPALTISSILFPKLTQKVATEGNQSAKYLYEKSVGTILCCVLPVVLIVLIFAEPITVLIAGEDYLEAAPILRITVLYSLLLPLNRQLGVTLEAIGKASLNFRFVVRNALMNIVFNYLFIQEFGVIGAAYGTLLTYTVSTVYNQFYLYRALHVRLVNVIRHAIQAYMQLYTLSLNQFKK